MPPALLVWMALSAAGSGLELDEVERIQNHLSTVERQLRAAPIDAFTGEQRAERARNLDRLHRYWNRARFPHNHALEGLAPVFIDPHGTACAVGQLIIESGHPELAEHLARIYLYARVPQMADPGLARWAAQSGLTVAELARIQPHYRRQCDDCLRTTGQIFHWNGKAWSDTTLPAERLERDPDPDSDSHEKYPRLLRLLGNGPKDLWLIGNRAIYRYDGTRWSTVQRGYFSATAGSSLDRLWVYGAGSDVHSYDGSRWFRKWRVETLKLDPSRSTGGTCLRDGTCFWLRDGVTQHSSSGTLELRSASSVDPHAHLAASGPGNVWITGDEITSRWDGTRWQEYPLRAYLKGLATTSEYNAWAFGAELHHFDGVSWKAVELPPSRYVTALLTTGPNEVWVAGGPGIFRRVDDKWVQVGGDLPGPIVSIWGEQPDDLWAVRESLDPCAQYKCARGP